MEEIWKPIDGYKGLYEISTFGRVKSLVDCHGIKRDKIVKPLNSRYGYLLVNLYKNKQSKSFRIHRLVAIAFIPNPLNLPFINHKDENKQNNCVENLEWCSPKYNVNYGNCRQKISEAQKGEKGNMYGKHHSEETRRKIGESHKGKKMNLSDAERKRRSDYAKSRTGANNPNFGKHFSEEHRRKISESRKRTMMMTCPSCWGDISDM